ncbi:hypothetical protein MATL_G00016130 [Megalops atlanticus]|uniref:Uncharacterized protein n=1 Tax=Megalops atlanticus TaxID=7932 RepID=A0A9D3QKS1_MEGAT|nr:hypothetical protein MATL_G00016130 [Megalops atlanticus]
MVALMRFTKDICRFLGIGSEGPDEQQEEMECVGGVSAQKTQEAELSQDVLSGEEGLSEEERARRRAERRRAKRKRQRERKKMEKEGKDEGVEEGGEEEEGCAELHCEESEEEDEEEGEEEEVIPRCKDCPAPPLAVSGNKTNWQPPPSSCEEEPEWDVSSAFVANAASHIRPKGRAKAGPGSKENKENEARSREMGVPVSDGDDVTKRSASLTEKGIRLVEQGQYSQAINMFTKAIRYNPNDYRFFGNRSYCHERLEQYDSALSDAEQSIQLAPDWPKGYFRKGRALMGMKRYPEAERAMEQVLQLDKDCQEAQQDLIRCQQLMALGFDEPQSVQLLERFTTVHAALSSPEAVRAGDAIPDQSGAPCPSLWVGNVTTDVTEKMLRDCFKTCGEIDSIRVLHERFCAFVNFKNAKMAARALETLQGVEIENTRLVIRYPDRHSQRVPPSPLRTAPSVPPQQASAAGPRRRGPVNGDECYFWRTTGCHFGDKCRYKHIPDQRGRDQKPLHP